MLKGKVDERGEAKEGQRVKQEKENTDHNVDTRAHGDLLYH